MSAHPQGDHRPPSALPRRPRPQPARWAVLVLVVAGALAGVSAAAFAAADPVAGTWQNSCGSTSSPSCLAPIKVAGKDYKVQELSYVQVDHKFYLLGGEMAAGTDPNTGQKLQKRTKDILMYDPQTNGWSKVGELKYGVDHVQAAVVGKKVYLLGGLDSWPKGDLEHVQIFDSVTKTTTLGAPMPAGRERGAGGVAVHGGKIYYAGGLHAFSNPDGTKFAAAVKWVDVYDPVANKWGPPAADMNRARDHFHAAVADGKLWAIGGRDVQIESDTGEIESYDFDADSWTTSTAQMDVSRGGYAAGTVGKEIVVIGGEAGDPSSDPTMPPSKYTLKTVSAFDADTGKWRSLPSLPLEGRHGIQAAQCNGGLYIAGGGTDPGFHPTNLHQALFVDGKVTKCEPPPPPTPPTPPTPPAPPTGPAPGGSTGSTGTSGSSGSSGSTGGQQIAPAIDVLAPRITALRIAKRSVRRGARLVVSLSLPEAATLRLTLKRRARTGNRYVTVRRIAPALAAGAATLRLSTRGMKAGRYRLVVTATDAAGNPSAAAQRAFRITR